MLHCNISNKSKWFTLVELIIVITILAILATIAFISFQWYSKNARDWNRLADLKNIKTWLEIYYTQVWNYPDTESWTLIQSSWWLTTIWTQWYFWDINSRLLKFSKTPTDPYDVTKYIYSINAQKNKFQILWFLETSDYVSLVKDTYAADYSTRIPKTLWDNLWILLDASNNSISWTWIDIENYTWSLNAIFSDSYNLLWTWNTIKVLKSSYKDWKMWNMIDKNCNLPDVVIWSQVWAWCNSTLWYWAEWWQTDNDISTNSYNWTVNAGGCRNYNWVNTVTTCTIWSSSMASTTKANTWYTWTNTNWDSEVNNIWWKFYTWNNLSTNCKWWNFTSSTSNNNCPCPTWWHVPTDTEWITLENSLWCTDSLTDNSWRCSWLWWLNNHTKIQIII